MSTIRWFKYLVLLILGSTSFAAAKSPVPLQIQRVLPLALAYEAAEAALKQCGNEGYRVSVAVVDAAGVLKVQIRADGAGPHTTDSSRKKAYTSASMRRATGFFADLIAKKTELAGLRDMNAEILILGGGLPIVIAGETVGGIGVGGAPGAHLDEACAQAGLTKIGADVVGSGKK